MKTIKEVLEFMNEKYPDVVDREELYKLFGKEIINTMRVEGLLQFFIDSDRRTVMFLTQTGFTFLIQQSINENTEKLNGSVNDLEESSKRMEILTKYLIALTIGLLLYTFILILRG